MRSIVRGWILESLYKNLISVRNEKSKKSSAVKVKMVISNDISEVIKRTAKDLNVRPSLIAEYILASGLNSLDYTFSLVSGIIDKDKKLKLESNNELKLNELLVFTFNL